MASVNALKNIDNSHRRRHSSIQLLYFQTVCFNELEKSCRASNYNSIQSSHREYYAEMDELYIRDSKTKFKTKQIS